MQSFVNLRMLSTTCYVRGVNDRAIQQRLLSESGLTLNKAFDTAQSMESASRDIQELHPSTDKVVSLPTAVEKVH